MLITYEKDLIRTRQVPRSMKKLIIGAGRIASHFEHYLHSLGQTPLRWDRKQNIAELPNLLSQASHVYLAISDRAIAEFIQLHLLSFNGVIVHFSGALTHPKARSAHPMMSFGPELYEPSFYKQIYFAIEPGTIFSELLPGLPNSFFYIPPEQKPFYHSLCVASGNLPQILWSLVHQETQKLHIPDSALHAYIGRIAQNWIQYHDAALTGPLVRKDWGTVNSNLTSLENSKIKNIYQEFVRTMQ